MKTENPNRIANLAWKFSNQSEPPPVVDLPHNRSPKPMRRLRHALTHLRHPYIQASCITWNRQYRDWQKTKGKVCA